MPSRYSRKTNADKSGSRIAVLDRRREAWVMRVSGYSYREIAEKQGTVISTAHRDCQIAEEKFSEMGLQAEVVREGLMALHGKLNGHLLAALERQLLEGQVTVQLGADGQVVGAQRKNWPNPQIAAELGRNLQRMAGLAGLDTAPVEGGASSNTTIILSAPADGCSFEEKWANADATTVDATATQAPPGTPTGTIQGSPGVDTPAQGP